MEGAGPTAVLIHGFAGDVEYDWRATGLLSALIRDHRRVVALDCRGHGESGKPKDPKSYRGSRIAKDVGAVIDHTGSQAVDLIGYSMGSAIAARLLVERSNRFRCAILGGAGWPLDHREPDAERRRAIVSALEGGATSATPAFARAFRTFAEKNGCDLQALAAFQRSQGPPVDATALERVNVPVLVLRGERDGVARNPETLAGQLPQATLAKVPGDHITAPASSAFRDAVLDFLARYSPS
ncbi:MAG: alpha/beta hydrolase [Dehalococcoidia bacterium]